MSGKKPVFGVALRFVTLCGIALAVGLPFVWMISASFKTRAEVDSGSINMIPKKITTANYPLILNMIPDPATGKKLDLKFGRWYFNSVFVAVGITLLQVLTSAMAAYAFSRMKWPGRDKVFLLYLATIMMPVIMTMIPNFQIMASLRLLNSYHGLILPFVFSAFGTFLLRQFMLSIPASLDEAAIIDGAGHWRIFWDVIMPLSRPGLIALSIITFLWAYGSFFWPLIMIHDPQLYPMPVGLVNLTTLYGLQTELFMAATTLNVVPLIVIFAIFQKYLVKGLQLGAVKG